MKLWTVAAALLSIGLPASAEKADFKAILSGKICPLKLKLRDLSTDWRRVTIVPRSSADANVTVGVNGGSGSVTNSATNIGGLGSIASGVYYTRGQTVSTGQNEYLIAYSLPARSALETVLQAATTGKPPAPEPLTADSMLTLSLLDIRTAGSLGDIREFDLQREIADVERVRVLILAGPKPPPPAPSAPPPDRK